MSCKNEYLPLCSIPARMSRDGWAGENAKIYVPFHGFLFFNGATFSTASATIPQDKKRFIGGVTKQGFFKKEGGFCGA